MAINSIHDQVSRFLARKFGLEYYPDKGADDRGRIVIEVETDPRKISEAKQQLQGYAKPRYIAGTNKKTVEAALASTEGTKIGVMDKDGRILRQAKRPSR